MQVKNYLDAVLDQVHTYKDHIWECHKCRDMPAQVALMRRDNEGLLPVPANVLDKISARTDSVPEMLDDLLCGIRDGKAPITMEDIHAVLLITDGYSVRTETDEVFDLKESYENDPNTNVTESITAYWAERNALNGCSVSFGRWAYHLNDYGKFEWDDERFFVIADEDDLEWVPYRSPLLDVFTKHLSQEPLS